MDSRGKNVLELILLNVGRGLVLLRSNYQIQPFAGCHLEMHINVLVATEQGRVILSLRTLVDFVLKLWTHHKPLLLFCSLSRDLHLVTQQWLLDNFRFFLCC